MLFGENGDKKRISDDNGSKPLDRLLEEISKKSFSKFSFKEDQIILNGKSIFDVVQEKLVEFWKRNIKPGALPEEDSKRFDNWVNRGNRKLYKNGKNYVSVDDENYAAQKSRIQEKLEKLQIVRKVFKTRSRRDQLVIDLRLFGEIDYREVAKRAQTTEANARKIVCDFKKECRRFGINSTEE